MNIKSNPSPRAATLAVRRTPATGRKDCAPLIHKPRPPAFLILAALALLALPLGAFAQSPYALDWFSLDGGGGTSAGGVYSVSATIGQPDAGTLSAGNYTLQGGFWPGLATQSEVRPLLHIANLFGTVVVFWDKSAAGFVLEETPALASSSAGTVWTKVPETSYQSDPTYVFISVPTPVGHKFYRLHKP